MPNPSPRIPVPAALLLVTALAAPRAQLVHPTQYTRAEASDGSQLPLGWTNVPFRVLQVHAGVPTGTLRGLAWRLDASAVDVAAFQAVIEISVSTSVTSATAPSSIFDANHGPDRVTVLPPGVVNFVAAPRTLAPRPFLHTIAFPTPFVRAGTAPLCWDLRMTNRSSAAQFDYDHANAANNPAATILAFGTGCRLFGSTTAMSLSATGSMSWASSAGVFRFSGSRLPASSLVALSVGGSATAFGSLPLPFSLPGTSTAPSGTCTLYNDSLAQVPVFTTASGTLATNTNLTFALHRSMNGTSLFTQLVAADPQANAYGLALTNSVQLHVSAPFVNDQVSRVWVGGTLTATGTVNAGYGAVTRFELQ